MTAPSLASRARGLLRRLGLRLPEGGPPPAKRSFAVT